jgi:hypothetical protein
MPPDHDQQVLPFRLPPRPARFGAAGALARPLAWARALVLAAALTSPAPAAGQSLPPLLAQFLRQTIALDAKQMSAVDAGHPVGKALDTPDHNEVALFGIVRIDVPRSFYVNAAADFPASLGSASRTRYGLLSDPASASDVAAVSVPHRDVDELAHCAAGSCKVKLPSGGITAIRAAIAANPESADSVVNAVVRARMVAYVNAYRADGDSALVQYADASRHDDAAQVFAGVLSRSPYMYRYAPSLERYLKDYPRDRPAGAHDVVFWAEDDLAGLRPTLTVRQEFIYAPPELAGCTLIVTKLLYASHYLDGDLDLTAVVDQERGATADTAGIYLVRLERMHFDNLPNGGLFHVRRRVIGQLLHRSEDRLRDAKARSEQAFARTAASSR